jgi:hypothetical protein
VAPPKHEAAIPVTKCSQKHVTRTRSFSALLHTLQACMCPCYITNFWSSIPWEADSFSDDQETTRLLGYSLRSSVPDYAQLVQPNSLPVHVFRTRFSTSQFEPLRGNNKISFLILFRYLCLSLSSGLLLHCLSTEVPKFWTRAIWNSNRDIWRQVK